MGGIGRIKGRDKEVGEREEEVEERMNGRKGMDRGKGGGGGRWK